MRMSAVAFGAVTIGLGLAIVWYLRPAGQAGEESKPVAHSARELPVDSGDRASRSRRAAEATAGVREPTAEPATDSTPGTPVAPATLPGQTPVTPMAQLIESMKREQAPPALVEGERAFSAEPVDATWAPGAETDIMAKFAEMSGLALTSLQVECRSTMCRLQVASPISPDPARPPFNMIVNSIGFEPRWLMSVVDSGTLQSVAYLSREEIVRERAQ